MQKSIAANRACRELASDETAPYADPGTCINGNVRRNSPVDLQAQFFDFADVEACSFFTDAMSNPIRRKSFNLADHAVFGQPSENASVSSWVCAIACLAFCDVVLNSRQQVSVHRVRDARANLRVLAQARIYC